jgi:hypothetical protein
MSKKKNNTPVAVRVARWTAVAAAITSLGTIGNTFIEKRPWFLGGDDIVAESVSVELIFQPEIYVPNLKSFDNGTGVQHVENSVSPDEDGIKHFSADPSPVISEYQIPYQQQQTMASSPYDGSLYNQFRYFAYENPVSVWIFGGSILLIGVFTLVEYLHRRKQKNMVHFDTPPPSELS